MPSLLQDPFRGFQISKGDPFEENLAVFVFKIQANMDPNHRDRTAFIRVCSGKFERGAKVMHLRSGKQIRLSAPTSFMAQDKEIIDEAYAGDIVGINDPGLFNIGDTLSAGEKFSFEGIPSFAPEYFCRVVLKNPLKNKQLTKGLDQLSEEGPHSCLPRCSRSTCFRCCGGVAVRCSAVATSERIRRGNSF